MKTAGSAQITGGISVLFLMSVLLPTTGLNSPMSSTMAYSSPGSDRQPGIGWVSWTLRFDSMENWRVMEGVSVLRDLQPGRRLEKAEHS